MEDCESGRAKRDCHVRVVGSLPPRGKVDKADGKPSHKIGDQALAGADVPLPAIMKEDSRLGRW